MAILTEHGDGMSIIKTLLMAMMLIIPIEGKEMEKIEKIWNNVENYWKQYDNKIMVGHGDKGNSIFSFEKKYDIIFPNELKYSLKRNYQYSRQGRNTFVYPWFGTNIGIDLLSIVEIEEFYNEYIEDSGLEDTELPHISVIYIGGMQFYDKTLKWNKQWIPIVCNDDIPIVLYIDLDKKSKNYLKIIGLWSGHIDAIGEHFRFAFIANNYIEFLSELEIMFMKYQKDHNHLMTETESGKGFEFYYYEKKFQLPKGFWTDKYREDTIRKMGLK